MRISDWSSDVCSAVLSACGPRQGAQVVSVDRKQIIDADERRIIGAHLLRDHLAAEPLLESVEARGFTPLHLSSEERRVGKECVRTCRSRWSPYHSKQNHNHTTHRASYYPPHNH